GVDEGIDTGVMPWTLQASRRPLWNRPVDSKTLWQNRDLPLPKRGASMQGIENINIPDQTPVGGHHLELARITRYKTGGQVYNRLGANVSVDCSFSSLDQNVSHS